MKLDVLTEREKEILESVIHQFVITGNPVGSRTLSKRNRSGLSPATVRNVMADLEERGFLGHPHTSAGRIPTTKGYRHYVDNLVKLSQLSAQEKELIKEKLGRFDGDVDYILGKTSQIMAKISNQLGVILTPKLDEGILEKIDVVPVSSDKILVILSIKDGLAKTILLEVRHQISTNMLERIVQVLNERISGLKINEIRKSFYHRIKDIADEETGLIRLFIDSAGNLFDFSRYADIKYTGTSNISTNPEFADINKFSALVELFEEKNIIIHIMERHSELPGLKVTIGDENEEKLIRECSIISAPYTFGNVDGVVGVIGPTRMAYKHIIPLVDFTAKWITRMFKVK
jgi:heat-inducible transcriptional repressor